MIYDQEFIYYQDFIIGFILAIPFGLWLGWKLGNTVQKWLGWR